MIDIFSGFVQKFFLEDGSFTRINILLLLVFAFNLYWIFMGKGVLEKKLSKVIISGLFATFFGIFSILWIACFFYTLVGTISMILFMIMVSLFLYSILKKPKKSNNTLVGKE